MLKGLNTYLYNYVYMNDRSQRRVDETCDRLNKYFEKYELRDVDFCNICNAYARKHNYRARITPNDLYRYRRGYCSPKIDKLTLMSHATGMSIEYITGYRDADIRKGTMPPPPPPPPYFAPQPKRPDVLRITKPDLVASTFAPIEKMEGDMRFQKMLAACKLCRELLSDGKIHSADEVNKAMMKAGYAKSMVTTRRRVVMDTIGAHYVWHKGYAM